jgi:hypothetical protein
VKPSSADRDLTVAADAKLTHCAEVNLTHLRADDRLNTSAVARPILRQLTRPLAGTPRRLVHRIVIASGRALATSRVMRRISCAVTSENEKSS